MVSFELLRCVRQSGCQTVVAIDGGCVWEWKWSYVVGRWQAIGEFARSVVWDSLC